MKRMSLSKRLLLVAPAAVLGGCWTPGPGQVDPTRYPWDRPKPEYCIVSLELGSSAGIVARDSVPTFEELPPTGGNAVEFACTRP